MGAAGNGIRVALDATPAMKAEPTGVAHYVRHLVQALATAAGPDDRFVLCHRLSRWRRRAWRLEPPDARFSRRWVHGAFGPRDADVAHGPDGRLLPLRRAARVVTIHDVFALEAEGDGRPAWREKMRARYRETAQRADLVLCVSAWTRSRFLAHFPDADATRLRVVPPGVDGRFRPEATEDLPALRASLGLDGPYALFVGALVPRKNPGVLLDAWTRLPAGAPALVLAGPDGGLLASLRAHAERLGIASRVRFAGHLDDAFVPALTAGATCLVLPSRMEGFGLPALEALACGTPVVHSARGGLREATGGHAIEVDPDDPEAVAAGVRRVLDDEATRARLRAEGLAYAAGFGWDRTARATLQAYRDATAARERTRSTS